MRLKLGIAILVCGAATAPAFARDRVAGRGDRAPRQLAEKRVAFLPGFAIARDFRVRVDLITVAAPNLLAAPTFLDDPDGNLRRRFASSMMDFYPVGGSGFHLSGGMRFYDRTNFARDAEKATHGLLYLPRMPGGSTGVRSGYRRFTPAMTMGYTRTLDDQLVMGIEAGTLIGRANAGMPRAVRQGSVNLGEEKSGMNPIVNLVFGLKF